MKVRILVHWLICIRFEIVFSYLRIGQRKSNFIETYAYPEVRK